MAFVFYIFVLCFCIIFMKATNHAVISEHILMQCEGKLVWLQMSFCNAFKSVMKYVFEKSDFAKKSADDNKSMKNYRACKKS